MSCPLWPPEGSRALGLKLGGEPKAPKGKSILLRSKGRFRGREPGLSRGQERGREGGSRHTEEVTSPSLEGAEMSGFRLRPRPHELSTTTRKRSGWGSLWTQQPRALQLSFVFPHPLLNTSRLAISTPSTGTEKALAPLSSTLAWRIPGMEEPGGLQSMGSQSWSNTTERLHFHFSLSRTGEGNGNPLRCSCLENPRDGGAWWAAVCGVAQSRTRLK